MEFHLNNHRLKYSLLEVIIFFSISIVLSGLIVQSLISNHRACLGLQCQSSLKYLGNALLIYSENNDDLLPHEDFGATQPPRDHCWYHVLQAEFGNTGPEMVLQDPSLKHLHGNGIESQGFSFKFNSRLEDYKGNKSFRSPPFRHMNSFHQPDISIIFFDGDVSPSQKNKPYGMHLQVVNRHNNKANLLCVDGAVHQDNGGFHTHNWINTAAWIWDPDASIEQQ